MIKVTEKTYFDYLDNLLSPEDIQSFEDHIANNPDAKLKLDKLVQAEEEFNKKINVTGLFELYLLVTLSCKLDLFPKIFCNSVVEK